MGDAACSPPPVPSNDRSRVSRFVNCLLTGSERYNRAPNGPNGPNGPPRAPEAPRRQARPLPSNRPRPGSDAAAIVLRPEAGGGPPVGSATAEAGEEGRGEGAGPREAPSLSEGAAGRARPLAPSNQSPESEKGEAEVGPPTAGAAANQRPAAGAGRDIQINATEKLLLETSRGEGAGRRAGRPALRANQRAEAGRPRPPRSAPPYQRRRGAGRAALC